MNQLGSGIQQGNVSLETTKIIPSTLKKVLPQQVARSENSVLTTFVFHVTTHRQKRAIFRDTCSFTENLISNSTNYLLFERHCNDFHSIPPIREPHDFHLYYNPFRNCESSFADVTFTVVFHPVKKINIGTFSNANIPRGIFLTIQVVFVHCMNKLQEANEILEQAIVVSSVIDELRNKHLFFETSEVDKVEKS